MIPRRDLLCISTNIIIFIFNGIMCVYNDFDLKPRAQRLWQIEGSFVRLHFFYFCYLRCCCCFYSRALAHTPAWKALIFRRSICVLAAVITGEPRIVHIFVGKNNFDSSTHWKRSKPINICFENQTNNRRVSLALTPRRQPKELALRHI